MYVLTWPNRERYEVTQITAHHHSDVCLSLFVLTNIHVYNTCVSKNTIGCEQSFLIVFHNALFAYFLISRVIL